MPAKLNADQKKLLTQGKNFAHLATLNADGSPQVSPIWIDMDGDDVMVNTEDKRLKTKNMRRDPRVSISVVNAENPYEYLEIRGRVKEITPTGGFEHIDKMAKKYMGVDDYPLNKPGDVRILVRVQPERITGWAR